jgi:hypothetical protein
MICKPKCYNLGKTNLRETFWLQAYHQRPILIVRCLAQHARSNRHCISTVASMPATTLYKLRCSIEEIEPLQSSGIKTNRCSRGDMVAKKATCSVACE